MSSTSASSIRSRSTKSLKERIIDVEVSNSNPVRFLASCLFFTIHATNASKIIGKISLGDGVHRKLEINMYETAESLKETGFDYLQRCHDLYCQSIQEYMKFDQFVEMLLNKFADSRLLKRMKRENYSSVFRSILHRAGINYISDLKMVSQTLYAYDDPNVYREYCIKFMHSRLVSAIETSVHMLLGDSSRTVPLELYEIAKKDRDSIFIKYKRLKKKYNRLRNELEE